METFAEISRTEAIARGLKRFFEGKACIRGHVSERYTRNRGCVQCDYLRCEKYRAENSETIRAKNRKYYYGDIEKAHEQRAAYQRNHPELMRAKSAERYAAKLQRIPSWVDMNEIRAIYNEAHRITSETNIPHEVDHIVPLLGEKVSGLHVRNNLQVIPATMNRVKSNRHEDIL